MIIKKWKKLSSQTIYRHPRITLDEDIVRLPNGHTTSYLKYHFKNHSVLIICLKGTKVLVQKEYSYPPDEILLQFPGGKLENGEDPINGARRELIEESGLAIREYSELGWLYTDNRRSEARMYVFLATKTENVEKKGGDQEETIISEWVEVEKISSMISEGKIVNYSLLAAWSIFLVKTQQSVDGRGRLSLSAKKAR